MRLRRQNKENCMIMFIHFFCFCPLCLTIKLNCNISKVDGFTQPRSQCLSSSIPTGPRGKRLGRWETQRTRFRLNLFDLVCQTSFFYNCQLPKESALRFTEVLWKQPSLVTFAWKAAVYIQPRSQGLFPIGTRPWERGWFILFIQHLLISSQEPTTFQLLHFHGRSIRFNN